MNDPIIVCPNCHTKIKLTESLTAPLLKATRREYEDVLATKEEELSKRNAEIAAERASFQDQLTLRLAAEREKISLEESRKAAAFFEEEIAQKSLEMSELHRVLEDRNAKLGEAQKVQAELIRKQRELDDAKREFDLTIETKVQESLAAVREKAKSDAEEGLKHRVLEKEEQIASMQRQIEELRRKAEQGSQQLQGEVQELELESLLRTKFPHDLIEPVPKGEFGGDVLHRVASPAGQICGTILWETKRTKNWTDGWLAKLRDDQRAAKAEVALLVTNVLPKGVVAFDMVDGVWVTEVRYAIPVAIILRQSLIELSSVRFAGEGQQSKMELVYQYLTGPRFRHRIEAIVEKFSDMQSDLDRERKTMVRQWAKREAQIRGVIESTVGMYGDLQGIAGRSLQEIEGLDFQLIGSPDLASEKDQGND